MKNFKFFSLEGIIYSCKLIESYIKYLVIMKILLSNY